MSQIHVGGEATRWVVPQLAPSLSPPHFLPLASGVDGKLVQCSVRRPREHQCIGCGTTKSSMDRVDHGFTVDAKLPMTGAFHQESAGCSSLLVTHTQPFSKLLVRLRKSWGGQHNCNSCTVDRG
jgi:hypothetical protein